MPHCNGATSLRSKNTYRDLADLLIDAGRLAEAQQVLAMLKEEEYSDFIRLRSAARPAPNTRATYTVEEQTWHNRYGELNGELAAVGEALAALQKKQRELASEGQSLDAADLERLEELAARQREIRGEFDGQLSALRAYFAKIGGEPAVEFGRKDLDSLQALQGVLRRIERASAERVVLLTYLITERKLRILLTSSNTLLHRDVDAAPEELNRLVFALRQSVQDVTSDPKPLAHELYSLLVTPVQADLDVINADILLTSLDGALRYLPMSVLHDGQVYLAERYALGVFTPAARLNLERLPDSSWTAAGMGVTQPGDGFLSLPSVGMELDRIVREKAEVSDAAGSEEETDSGILDGRIWLDGAFTAQSLVEASVAGFKVIHIASHFVFKPGNERDSFLLLGDGNRLTLDEFVADAYQFEHLDLLTLSACDTALGGDTASGKEIEGFGALAQNKGASAVLATLWPVADDSTAEIMAGFYEFRQVRGMSKVQALRAVKRAFINGDDAITADLAHARGNSTGDSRDEELAHPYYWAPFILMGNWQ